MSTIEQWEALTAENRRLKAEIERLKANEEKYYKLIIILEEAIKKNARRNI